MPYSGNHLQDEGVLKIQLLNEGVNSGDVG